MRRWAESGRGGKRVRNWDDCCRPKRWISIRKRCRERCHRKRVGIRANSPQPPPPFSHISGAGPFECDALKKCDRCWHSRKTENAIKEANLLARETEHFRQESIQMLRENEEKRKEVAAADVPIDTSLCDDVGDLSVFGIAKSDDA